MWIDKCLKNANKEDKKNDLTIESLSQKLWKNLKKKYSWLNNRVCV